jgi:1,4-alpha-glucan branching enzyme
MKRILTLLLLWPFLSMAQMQIDLPITWDDPAVDYTVVDFGNNVSSVVVDPTNPSNFVLQSTKTDSAATWAGTTLGNQSLANPIPFASGNTIIKVVVWSPDANIPVRLKAEDHTDAGISVETQVNTTVAGAWDTLVFDFSNPAPGTAPINFANTYDMLSIFYNFDTDGATAGSKTYYCDLVEFDTTAQPPQTGPLYCNEEVTHLGIPAEIPSTIFLTIANNGPNSMIVEIESADADTVDFLLVNNGSGAVISPEDFSVPGKISRTLTWAVPPATVDLNVLWSKVSFPGNWQLSPTDVTVPFTDTCGAPLPVTYNVTFKVNMNSYTGTYTTPEVNGDFNGWCGGCAPMSDIDGDNVWELTVPISADSIEFKYAYDNWAGQENLTPGDPCTKTTSGFTNRFIVLTGDTVLPAYCWDSCSVCSTPPPTVYNVTFQVDMNSYTGTYITPEVNGDFNGWCGGCAPMFDPDGNNLWELTVPIAADSIEFKFAYDNWTGQENLTPGDPCTKTSGGFTNRFVVLTGDTVLPAYCWDSCSVCSNPPPTTHNVTFQVDMSHYTGPAYTDVNLNGEFNGWCGACAVMTDMNNDDIYELTIPVVENDTVEYKFTLDGWTVDEQLMAGMPCVVTTGGFTNRYIYISGDTTLPPVCWESCDTCSGVPPTGPLYCNEEVTHLGLPAEIPSKIYLTIANTGPNSMIVEIESFDADTVDFLLVNNGSGATISPEDFSVPGKISRTLTWTTPPATVDLNVLWSKVSFAVNWQLNPTDVTVPFTDTCGPIPPATYNVTFQVDMNSYTGTFTTPEVNGDFNGWCGGCAPMADPDGNGIWELTVPIMADSIEFKYAYDNWTGQENLTPGDPCTKTTGGFTNRFILLTGDTVLPAYCWDSCSTCGSTPPVTRNVTFQVDMSQYTGGPYTDVNLNGTFNGWCGGCALMTDANNDDIYEITVPLNEGDSIEYKFTLDGWNVDEQLMPGMPCVITDGTFTNRFLVVPSSDTMLSAVCWESCDTCASTPPSTYNVTFRVDMSQYGGTYTTPEVNGDFNGWCGGCAPMADPDGDSIWELVVPITADSIEFKYAYDNWTGQENLTPGTPCTKTSSGFTNRFVVLTGDTVLPAYCWESCDSCSSTPPATYDVTFQVDLSDYAGSYGVVNLNGTFNGWCGGCAVMTDVNNDTIFELTVPLNAGDTAEYKFTLDGWTVDETLMPGMPCVVTTGGFTNRFLVPTADTTLPPVCWESCAPCDSLVPTALVTFQVDLSQYGGGAYTDVNLNGTFNGWCGGCAVMTDANNDSIYELTVPLDIGVEVEYKFTLDGWNVDEQLMQGMPCTKTTGGFTNRVYTPTSDTTLLPVCWESCDTCFVVSTGTEIGLNSIEIFPNPTTGLVQITGNLNASDEVRVTITDSRGAQLYQRVNQRRDINQTLDLSDFDSGIYFITIGTSNDVITRRILLAK